MKSKEYFTIQGKVVGLGKELGKGGEGSVFAVEGATSQVAKIYSNRPDERHCSKLWRMQENHTAELLQFTCWPVSCLFDRPNGNMVGFGMPRAYGKAIHVLYGPKSRLKEFPKGQWSFLLVAARNLAACIDTMHKHGHVVGDVNHSNALVNDDARVSLIDCDSFQVNLGGIEYRCPVGVDTHTPPELQGLQLNNITRTFNHDNFGLAVLIFQLLFMGRHPFSGRFLGQGDLTVAKAIAEYRFAFGKRTTGRLMEPPPNSLPLEALPICLQEFFEQAFVRQANGSGQRPSASAWVRELDLLAKSLKTCPVHPSHEFWSQTHSCPWCIIEGNSGFHLFPRLKTHLTTSTSTPSPWHTIQSTSSPGPLPRFPDPGFQRLQPSAKAEHTKAKVPGGLFSRLKSWLRFNAEVDKEARELEKELSLIKKELSQLKQQWKSDCGEQKFTAKRKELETLNKQLSNLPKELAAAKMKVHEQARRTAPQRHLQSHKVWDAPIYGIGDGLKSTLISYGFHTAADVRRNPYAKVPGFGDVRWGALQNWARRVESTFRFDPTRDIDHRQIGILDSQFQSRQFELERKLQNGGWELASIATRIMMSRNQICASCLPLCSKRDQLKADIGHLRKL